MEFGSIFNPKKKTEKDQKYGHKSPVVALKFSPLGERQKLRRRMREPQARVLNEDTGEHRVSGSGSGPGRVGGRCRKTDACEWVRSSSTSKQAACPTDAGMAGAFNILWALTGNLVRTEGTKPTAHHQEVDTWGTRRPHARLARAALPGTFRRKGGRWLAFDSAVKLRLRSPACRVTGPHARPSNAISYPASYPGAPLGSGRS